jgi:nucleoside-diphosphate-sugar epimerase
MKYKTLVTGGAGMIGSTLVKSLINIDHDVYVIDNLFRGDLNYLKDSYGNSVIDFKRRFFNLDLRNKAMIEELGVRFDIV